MTRTARVCPRSGCPHLRPCPVDGHERRPSAPWSRDRDRGAQHLFRLAVLARDNYTCTRCGHHDPTGRTLEAHHVRPGYQVGDGITVCTAAAAGCHRRLDLDAR